MKLLCLNIFHNAFIESRRGNVLHFTVWPWTFNPSEIPLLFATVVLFTIYLKLKLFLPDSETTEDESEEPTETKEDEANVEDQVVHTGTQHLFNSLSQ